MMREITLDEALKIALTGSGEVFVVDTTPLKDVMVGDLQEAVKDGAKFMLQTEDETPISVDNVMDLLIGEDTFSGEEAIAKHEETEVFPPLLLIRLKPHRKTKSTKVK